MGSVVKYERTLFEPEHELFRESYRAFLDRHVAPYHEQWEKDKIVDRGVWLEAGKQGFLGMAVPEEYGGGGNPDFRYNVVLTEETTAGRYSGIGFGLHNESCGGWLPCSSGWNRPLPAGRVPGRRRRKRPGRAADEPLPHPARDRARGALARTTRRAGCSALPDLPAPALVVEARRAGRAHDAASTSGTTRTASSRTSRRCAALVPGAHGPLLGRAVAGRDGGGHGRVRRAGRRAGALRLPLGVDAARGRRLARARRPRTASTAARRPCSRSA